MSGDTSVLDKPLPTSLDELVAALESKTHHLASNGDEGLAKAALEVSKELFDLGLSLEPLSHPHLHPFLIEILQPASINLRSSTKAKSEVKEKSPTPPPPEPSSVLPYTPLSVLTVEGMEAEQIWQQLELRNEGIAKVIKEVGGADAGEEGEVVGFESEEEESDDDDEGSDEEMTEEEFRRMFEEAEVIGSDETDAGSGNDEDYDFDEADSEGEDGEFGLRDEMDEEDGEYDEEDEDEMEFDGEDDLSGSLGSDDEAIEEEEEDEGEDEEQDEDDSTALSLPGLSNSRKKKSHPTLDDEFFSIDQFNQMTEMAEAGRVSSGRLGKSGDDEDEEDEEEGLGDMASMMLQSADEDATVMYSDFFDPPKREYVPPSKWTGKDDGKGRGKAKGKGKEKAASNGERVRFGDDEILNEDEDEEGEDERGVMGRVKGDLFDDDDDDEKEEKQLSTHEKRQLALAKQIAELEQAVIGPKDWTLMGEASARARPENSLLEEDLDFEQVGKVVPVVTEESVKTLEEMIKIRIRDNNFNSPVRVQAFDPTPFLPSRFFELQDTQSTKSLAQIYEDEYQAAAAGGKVRDPRDEKLKKDHEEIEKLWGEICYKLDALSSLNFVPKQPKAQITTITNLPTTTMESALPPTAASTTLLAPEELFAPPTSSALISRTEQTPEEKQRSRLKSRKARKANFDKLGAMAELYGKGKGGKKGEKERALEGLVKTGKGVTVVGKGEKEVGKVRKRSREEGVKEDGKRLKL